MERKQIAQEVTLSTRRAKSHTGETAEQRLDRWERQCRQQLEGGLAKVARLVLRAGREQEKAPERWDPRDVIDRATDVLRRTQQATWTRSDMVRAISDALPGHLGVSGEEAERLIERLTDYALDDVVVTRPAEPTEGLPDELRLQNGASVYQQPGGERYAAPGQLAAEQVIADAGRWRGAPAVSREEAEAAVARFAEQGHELGADQRAALLGILSSGVVVETLAAPAGAGKSFTVGAIHDSWTTGRVFGLAPSQVAADVLKDEGVTVTGNLTAWQNAHDRGEAWAQLGAGDLVVVDEAGMAPTDDIARVVSIASAAGAKVLLVGDPRQLGAVGPGGALADIGARGGSYELTEVRRFRDGWERESSLRLRDCDPHALAQYDRHGRIRDAETQEQAQEDGARAWLADTLDGKESLLIVGTNEGAAQASGSLRAQLVRLGRVEEAGAFLERDGNVAGVGDRVQARRNGWELLDSNDPNKRCPINRDTYEVVRRGDDGSVTVRDSGGHEIELPADYVRKDVALAYATTVYGAQGRTVDTGHIVVAPGADAGSVYVGLTRGRESNTAWVVTQPLPEKSPTGEVPGRDGQPGIEPRTGRAVIAEVLENAEEERGALAEIEQARADAESEVRGIDRLADGVAQATTGRASGILDTLVAEGSLAAEDRERLAADGSLGAVERQLRAAELNGHDPADVLRGALHDKPLTGARSPVQVLHSRVESAVKDTPARGITGFRDLIPGGISESWRHYLEQRADQADDRRHKLGAEAAENPPAWALEKLGPVPEHPLARADWETRAGWVEAWRENQQRTDTDDEADDKTISASGPLGAAPKAGLADKRAIWATASAQLGGADVSPEEANMTDGQLRNRVAAYDRERGWAPRWVHDELAATAQQAAQARIDATVLDAHGQRPGGEEHATAAERARAEAEELRKLQADLEAVDEARARWFAHTAAGRDKSERAKETLKGRGVDVEADEEKVTAKEWLDTDDAAKKREDPHRPIHHEDLDEDAAERPELDVDEAAQLGETGRPDIRETATEDDSERHPPAREVPEQATADDAVQRSRQALDEIADRHSLDETHGEEDEDESLPWWVGLDDDTADADDTAWTDEAAEV